MKLSAALLVLLSIPGFASNKETFPPTDSQGRKSATLHIPDQYNKSKPWPLIILLHGYSATGWNQNIYFGMSSHVDDKGFLLLIPEGTVDKRGNQFWNATEACCNAFKSTVDDEGYLLRLVQQVQAKYAVDANRISIFGHSNGGFMAYHMACRAAHVFSAIASFEGSTFLHSSDCKPDDAISILEIHAIDDPDIRFDGGWTEDMPGHILYPGAQETVNQWLKNDSCLGDPQNLEPMRNLLSLHGVDTTGKTWRSCNKNSEVQFWTIRAKTKWEMFSNPLALLHFSHFPIVKESFTSRVIQFLLSKSKIQSSSDRAAQ